MDLIGNGPFVSKLSRLIDAVRADPQLLYDPNLAFFKSYLTSLGATVPHKTEHEPEAKADNDDEDAPELMDDEEEVHFHGDAPKGEAPKEKKPEPEAEPEDPELSEPESEPEPEHEEKEIEGDVLDEKEHPFGNEDVEVSEEQQDQAADLAREGDSLKNASNFAEAIKKYNEAINIEPAARLVAARSLCFLALKKPRACIFDCDHALKTNPNSTRAFTARAQAYILLEKWEEAFADFTKAQACDYNSETAAKLKEIKPKVDERVAKEKDHAAKKKAREAKQAAAAAAKRKSGGGAAGAKPRAGPGAAGGGMPTFPGMEGLPPELLQKMMSDPELVEAMSDPDTVTKLQALMTSNDPAQIANIKDPKLLNLVKKLQKLVATTGLGGKKK